MTFKALALTRTLSGKKKDEFPRPPTTTKSRKAPPQSAKLRAKTPTQTAMGTTRNMTTTTMMTTTTSTSTSIQQSTMEGSSEPKQGPKRLLWRMRSSKESPSAASSNELHGTATALVVGIEETKTDCEVASESDDGSNMAQFEHDLLSTFSWGSLDSDVTGTLNTDKTTNTDKTGATELTLEFYERPLKCCGFVF